jgi:two-component system phosphate regulon sensor histidine kinase PhoR
MVVVAGWMHRARRAALMDWLRGQPDRRRRATPASGANWATASSARCAARAGRLAQERRAAQFLSAIEASPNGVLLLDATTRSSGATRGGRPLRPGPGARPAQRITNLVRAPAFVAYLQAGSAGEPVILPPRAGAHAVGAGAALRRRHALVLSQDITERERAEAMRRDFVANVSHEIRTPLTVLAGFVETMATCR